MTQNEEDELLQVQNYDDIHDPRYAFTVAKVISVYDGDTFTIIAKYYDRVCRFNVRLYGVDCEEMKGGTAEQKDSAKLAKKFVSDLVLDKIIQIDVLSNKPGENGKIVKEKYGRLLAKVRIQGLDLAEELVRRGLARVAFI